MTSTEDIKLKAVPEQKPRRIIYFTNLGLASGYLGITEVSVN
jgi:hypothetical protein